MIEFCAVVGMFMALYKLFRVMNKDEYTVNLLFKPGEGGAGVNSFHGP